MAMNSKIEWTHHTFNPWIGCTKVSEGCANCYAETRSKRFPDQGQWGQNGTRRVTSESNWKLPLRWNRAAEKAGERHRVFCASLADVFEADDTMPEGSRLPVMNARVGLFHLIMDTPHLDWLLLTKRPENIRPVLDSLRQEANHIGDFKLSEMLTAWLDGSPPHNVWLGTSVENQEQADKRIPALLRVPAALHFLSMEPLLGEVSLGCSEYDYLAGWNTEIRWNGNPDSLPELDPYRTDAIDWVIVGGESGKNARPMHPDWVRSIRDQCASAGVPFFFKQWGDWGPHGTPDILHHSFTTDRSLYRTDMYRVGKKAAGRLLDGREHNEMPEVK